jgi:hypothetical protein
MHHGPTIFLVPLNDIKIGQKQMQDDKNITNIEPNNNGSVSVYTSNSQTTKLYLSNNTCSSYKEQWVEKEPQIFKLLAWDCVLLSQWLSYG